MKYIDAEKLKAEIERELSAHDKVDHLEAFEVGKAWSRGHRQALEDILSFITSLQQEQQEVDLEGEYKTWWNSISGKINVEHMMEWYMHETARHFYELGLKTKEESK